jgi:hypothetical protein
MENELIWERERWKENRGKGKGEKGKGKAKRKGIQFHHANPPAKIHLPLCYYLDCGIIL